MIVTYHHVYAADFLKKGSYSGGMYPFSPLRMAYIMLLVALYEATLILTIGSPFFKFLVTQTHDSMVGSNIKYYVPNQYNKSEYRTD